MKEVLETRFGKEEAEKLENLIINMTKFESKDRWSTESILKHSIFKEEKVKKLYI